MLNYSTGPVEREYNVNGVPRFVQCTRWTTMFNPLVKRQKEARALRNLGFSSKGRKYEEHGRNVFVRMKCLRSH